MRLALNEVCDFTFETRFVLFDGIYRVVSIHNYDELLENDVDLEVTLYEAASLSEESFLADLPKLRSYDLYKLEKMVDGSILYIPLEYTSQVPDPNVGEYNHIGIALNMGVFNDVDKINWVLSELSEVLTATLGVTESPMVFEIKKEWLPDADYKALETAREATITQTDNHYTREQKQTLENQRLRGLVDQYESTLVILDT